MDEGYVEEFLHPDGRIFQLEAIVSVAGYHMETRYTHTDGSVTSDKEAYDTMALAREYRRGILNMLEWSGFVGSHNLQVTE